MSDDTYDTEIIVAIGAALMINGLPGWGPFGRISAVGGSSICRSVHKNRHPPKAYQDKSPLFLQRLDSRKRRVR